MVLQQTRTQCRTTQGALSPRLLFLLAFVAATSPLAIDLYLASFPDIQREFQTTPAMVQLTLTAYLLGIAVGQPIWGPLSDRYGRRRPLLISNALTLVSSIAIVVAPSIEALIGARFLQALSAAAGIVIARAMLADLTTGYAGVRALALMMTIHGATPVVAPLLGGALAMVLSWRGVLAVFAAFVTLQLLVSVWLVRETLPADRRATRLRYADLATVCRRPAFVAYGLTVGCAVAAVMVFVANASFVFQGILGFSPLLFGVVFAVNALAMMAAGLLSAKLASLRIHPASTARWGVTGMVLSCLAVTAVAASDRPVLMVPPLLVHGFFANLAMSNAMGLAMHQAEGASGAGSAALGLLMFGLSALVVPIVGVVGGADSAVSMGTAMTALAVLAGVFFGVGRRRVASHPASESAFG